MKSNEELEYTPANVWDKLSGSELQEMESFCRQYLCFLNQARTERECVDWFTGWADTHGFVRLEDAIDEGKTPEPGSRLYTTSRGKNAAMIIVGRQDITAGLNIIASHIDSPRLDLKQHPLIEDDELAMLKTHYYGGLKKYQWLALPLSLHGVIYRADGSKLTLSIGDKAEDPVFTIADLLPHLGKDQMKKSANEFVVAEKMNILVGSIPLADSDAKNKVKAAVLQYLYERYDLEEEDFVSAELEAVPALPAREIGFDRSLIGAYGQDDRVCAFTSLKALGTIDVPERTVLVYFADKEEIGSTGNTGMQSCFLDNTIAELINLVQGSYSELICRRVLSRSQALSADVTAALDPNYSEVMEKNNCSRLGRGISIDKYTGSRGKYDASDANAEYLAKIRQLFNRQNIIWQTGELGKVDMGGGGTVAYLLAAYGMEVLDCGTCMLGMHSPYEVTSKADIYMTWKAYAAFLAAD